MFSKILLVRSVSVNYKMIRSAISADNLVLMLVMTGGTSMLNDWIGWLEYVCEIIMIFS